MNIIYDILFRVSMRHDYYNSGFSDDFEIVPTQSCQHMLNSLGFLFKKEDNGFVILAKIKPKVNGVAPELFTSIGDNTLRFSFEMRLRNVYFHNITTLPSYDVGSEVFYFSNFHNAVNGNSPSLGDQIAGALLGTPMSIVSGYTQNVKFGHALNTATLEIKDIFQNLKTPVDQLSLAGTDESEDFQIDLRKVESLTPGRYTTEWSGNGSLGLDTGNTDFILEPGFKGNNTFGIIEIYNNTSDFPNNLGNNVPVTHRFLDGNTLVRSGVNNDQLTADYQVRLSTHEQVRWHYVLIKKSTSPTPSLASLTIPNFSETVNVEHVPVLGSKVLRSQNNMDVLETLPPFTMTSDLANYAPLMPQPSMDSNIKRINGQDPFYELYYYV